MKDETDDRVQQFKKKAKELRILDPKTAQNLCKSSVFMLSLVWCCSRETSSLGVEHGERGCTSSSFGGVAALILHFSSPVMAASGSA